MIHDSIISPIINEKCHAMQLCERVPGERIGIKDQDNHMELCYDRGLFINVFKFNDYS